MKNPTLIPLFSLTAAAAFGLGWFVRPDAGNDQKNPNDSESADRKSRVMTGSRPSGGESALRARNQNSFLNISSTVPFLVKT